MWDRERRRGKTWSIAVGQLLLLLSISNRSYASLCDQALQIVCESELTVSVCVLGLVIVCVLCVISHSVTYTTTNSSAAAHQ